MQRRPIPAREERDRRVRERMAQEPGRFRDETHCRTWMRRERKNAYLAQLARMGLPAPPSRLRTPRPDLPPPPAPVVPATSAKELLPCHLVVAKKPRQAARCVGQNIAHCPEL
ncbi:uncharacterized protein LOC128669017 [Microplitis demolitor]|uniref:uncharacterized protein LOC128669017 n=1 Tax=Microplitis demolitor TaxID=69319 RepID=UPI00235B6019|nr:uncharacterized protein LOC128669017 [Microplitis demolitor]